MTLHELENLATAERAKANAEPNQSSYNAGHLHGFADGIRHVLFLLQTEERESEVSYVYLNGATGEHTYSAMDARDWWLRGDPVSHELLVPDGA